MGRFAVTWWEEGRSLDRSLVVGAGYHSPWLGLVGGPNNWVEEALNIEGSKILHFELVCGESWPGRIKSSGRLSVGESSL